jgi:hypothetical protein
VRAPVAEGGHVLPCRGRGRDRRRA